MKDVLLQVITALPAQAAANNTAALDLGPNGGRNFGDEAQFLIDVPATPALVTVGQSISFGIEDSLDGATGWAAVPGYGAVSIPGGAGGGPATQVKLKVHDHVRRYVRFTQTASATAGNNTGVSTTIGLSYP